MRWAVEYTPQGYIMAWISHEKMAHRIGGMVVTPLERYALLLALVLSTIGFVAMLRLIARALGTVRAEQAKEIPFTGGMLTPQPAWVRYHVHYYGFALLFLAFDMEMAFMYPWAVVYQELGLEALLDMGIFLMVLFLGLLYGWSQGALKRQ
jgi:NADH-quinone oxidoreductase subunit A